MSACVSETLIVAFLLCVVTIDGAERIFMLLFCDATLNTLLKPYSSIESVNGEVSVPSIAATAVRPFQPFLPESFGSVE